MKSNYIGELLLDFRITFGLLWNKGRIPREVHQIGGPRRDYTLAPLKMTKAYLLGALHDGTIRKLTYRIVQKDQEYIQFLVKEIKNIGHNAWMYKEGKTRNLYVVEFSKNLLKDFTVHSGQDKIDYIRGYFDAKGGVSRDPKVRYYLYFAQKNLKDLKEIKRWLEELMIKCGSIHNPSKKVDPNYWRFFISIQSYEEFARVIGSWHPIKSRFLRMKI